MSDSQNLFSLARSKLQLSIGGKEKCSLHRWVLLKNSMVNSIPSPSSPSPSDSPLTNPLNDDLDEEVDSFMFPDAGKFVVTTAAEVRAVETSWLDSLLEQLGDDEEEDFAQESDTALPSPPPADEDDEHFFFSPSSSPLSSTDDLPDYFSPLSVVPYSYSTLTSHSASDRPLTATHSYSEPDLPFSFFHDLSESENLSVPGATEDNSDDESDVPSTPSICRSTTSLALIEAASLPLPMERSRMRRMIADVHIDGEDSYFYSFEPDPLPFRDYRHHHHHHQPFNVFC